MRLNWIHAHNQRKTHSHIPFHILDRRVKMMNEMFTKMNNKIISYPNGIVSISMMCFLKWNFFFYIRKYIGYIYRYNDAAKKTIFHSSNNIPAAVCYFWLLVNSTKHQSILSCFNVCVLDFDDYAVSLSFDAHSIHTSQFVLMDLLNEQERPIFHIRNISFTIQILKTSRWYHITNEINAINVQSESLSNQVQYFFAFHSSLATVYIYIEPSPQIQNWMNQQW